MYILKSPMTDAIYGMCSNLCEPDTLYISIDLVDFIRVHKFDSFWSAINLLTYNWWHGASYEYLFLMHVLCEQIEKNKFKCKKFLFINFLIRCILWHWFADFLSWFYVNFLECECRWSPLYYLNNVVQCPQVIAAPFPALSNTSQWI